MRNTTQRWSGAVAALALGSWIASGAVGAQARQTGRALTIEDYYRVQSVGGPQFSPDSRWILFSLTTRVEENQGSRSESYVVPTDAAAPARRLQHEGRDVTGASWTPAGRLRYTVEQQAWTIDPANPGVAPEKTDAAGAGGRGGGRGGGGRGGGGRAGGPGAAEGGAGGGTASPDGRWTIVLRDVARPQPAAPALTDFDKRHEDRFRGVTFDWMEFQRDGQAFPAPNMTNRPGQQVVLQAAADAATAPKTLMDRDVRPTGVVWHPGGSFVAFLADTTWRDELKYERPDIWIATVDGKLTQLTDDGYVHSRSGVLAGRQVHVVRADVRHRHDRRQEAEPRRAARLLRPRGRRRRRARPADQPHREMGSRTGQRAVGARQQVRLLDHRRRR